MAEGYAAATGRLGVAVIGRGPPTANGLHASVYASRTGSQVLIISGDAAVPGGSPNGLGPDYKAFNAAAVLPAAGLRTFVATSPDAARSALADAVAVAQRGTAAVLLLPVNVQLAEWIAARRRHRRRSGARRRARRAAARAQSIAAAAAVLARARRPLIIAGLGAHRAGARGRRWSSSPSGSARCSSPRSRARICSAAIPYNLGVIGSFSHSAGRRMIDQADCVLVFGAGLNLLTMSFGMSVPQGVPVIQVDAVRGNIGRWTPPMSPWSGDAKLVGRATDRGGCRAARGRQAVPRRGDAAAARVLRHRARFPGGAHAAHGRPARARRGAEQAAAGEAQHRLRRRQLPRHRALHVGARSGPFQDDQRLRLDRPRLRHRTRLRQGAARRDDGAVRSATAAS